MTLARSGIVLIALGAVVLALVGDDLPDRSRLIEMSGRLRRWRRLLWSWTTLRLTTRTTASLVAIWGIALAAAASSTAADSVCYGTSSNGRLEGGVQIPTFGPNFAPYSSLGVKLGRTYVHSKVAVTVAAAYKALEASAPTKTYVYGESGWRDGGRIRPHRTHQNGLAVDFMVPVMDATGKSVRLPTGLTNKFGYSIEFDAQARYQHLSIDFEAMSEHLYALSEAARENGVRISQVIFEKAYLPRLYTTRRGAFVRDSIPFMQGEPWIRHDEHYHVDFAVPCKAK